MTMAPRAPRYETARVGVQQKSVVIESVRAHESVRVAQET